MAKFGLRIKARQLRSQGLSVKQITNELGIAKSTCSLWVRDIILSVDQLEKLRQRVIRGSELGRIKGALIQKQRRLRKLEEWRRIGISDLRHLKNRELLIANCAVLG